MLKKIKTIRRGCGSVAVIFSIYLCSVLYDELLIYCLNVTCTGRKSEYESWPFHTANCLVSQPKFTIDRSWRRIGETVCLPVLTFM